MRVVITHTDLDGVASAAILLRQLGRIDKYVFTQPHVLHKALSAVRCPEGCEIYVCDLSPNTSNYEEIENRARELVRGGARIWWFDHHVWESRWIEGLLEVGVKLSVDTKVCAAGVVLKHFGDGDQVSKRIAEAACSLDMWVFDDWLGNFLARYVGYSKSVNWRRKVAEKLAKGSLLDEEIMEAVEETVDRELEILSEALRKCVVREACGTRVVYYYKAVKDHVTSYVASLLMSRFAADVAVVCRRGSVSLRSCGRIDVREIAKRFGGGGHPAAAGFSVRPPLLLRLLLFLGIKGPYIKWCASRIERVLCELGENYSTGAYGVRLRRAEPEGRLERRARPQKEPRGGL